MNKPMIQNSNEESQEQDMGSTPVDSMIARVDEYIQNPKLVTPQTLQELKSELEDLKKYLDGEETSEPETGMDHNGGVAIMISNMKKGMKK